jgi:hypothetical protein
MIFSFAGFIWKFFVPAATNFSATKRIASFVEMRSGKFISMTVFDFTSI